MRWYPSGTFYDKLSVYSLSPSLSLSLTICVWLLYMADNHLKLNEEKKQIIWLGTRQQLNKVTARALTLPDATVEFSTTVKDLGVVLDSQLTMADHNCCTQPILLLLHPAAQVDKTVIDNRCNEDTGVRLCQQSHRLLQQHPRWCQRSTATEAAISPECSCTSGHWSPEIRSHDAYSTPTALATSTPANYFEDGRTGIQIYWYTVGILWANVITRRSVSPCALLSPVNSLFHVRVQTTDTAVLPFRGQSCGTVFQPISVKPGYLI